MGVRAAAPGLTRLGVRMPVMHVCSCGVNVGSWKGMISRLLDKLEEEAVVSTVRTCAYVVLVVAPPTLKYYPSTVVLRAHVHSSVRHHDKLGTRT